MSRFQPLPPQTRAFPSSETPYDKVMKFVERDTNFTNREYQLLSQLSDEQRLKIARIKVKKAEGISDCTALARNLQHYKIQDEATLNEITKTLSRKIKKN